jgi:hypothetical protein
MGLCSNVRWSRRAAADSGAFGAVLFDGSQLNLGVRHRTCYGYVMASDYDLDLAGEFVLALMAFEIHDGGRAWKGFPWEVLAHLHEQGLISDPKSKAKSVVLSEEGEALACAARDRLLRTDTKSTPKHGGPARTGAKKAGTFTDIQHRQIERLIAPICAARADPAVRSQLRIDFRVDGLSVVLFESRPGFIAPHEWRDEPVAKFTYVKSSDHWKLFCMLRDLKWHRYEPFPESRELAPLIAEVRADPTGIFWG